MSAISFYPEFLDDLLSGKKQQTTRQQTTMVAIGGTGHLYIEQRKAITSKPIRKLTYEGCREMLRRVSIGKMNYPPISFADPTRYYAHCLGKVNITEVYDIHPCEMSGDELQDWAVKDGFKDFINADFEDADTWFRRQYGYDWMQQMWTVIKWNGWIERYFSPER